MKRGPGRPALVGGIVLVIIIVVTVLAFRRDIPFVNQPYTIKAAFTDTHGIKKGSPVRIAGVEAGRVVSVEGTSKSSRSAVVTMSIKDKARPVHVDASARIRPRIFLEGNFYVQLSPGSPGTAELDEDAAIPVQRTSSAVQLDEVLKALKSDVRRDLRGIFAELFRAEAEGGAKAFNGSLRDQAAAYKYSAIVSEALLGKRPGDLADFVRDQGIVSGALDRDREALKSLITNFNVTFGALADREADLRSAIDELPSTLEAALPTFLSLNGAFPDVRRFARAAIPGIRSLGPTARAATPLVTQLAGLVGDGELRGLSRDLRASTGPLASLASESVPLLEQMRTLGSCTDTVLVPWGNSRVGDPNFPAVGPVHREFPKSLVGLAGESRSFDANGQWFKVLGTGGLDTFELGGGLLGSASTSIMGTNPPADRTRPPLMGDTPCETQKAPDLRSIPAAGPTRVNTNTSSKLVQDRIAKARSIAIDIENAKLKAAGSTRRVLDRDVSLQEIQGLAKGLGLEGQLQTLSDAAARVGK